MKGQYDKNGNVIEPIDLDILPKNDTIPLVSIDDELDDIGEDTDQILVEMAKSSHALNKNTDHTLSTKRWVITLFLLDKIIMFLILYLTLKYGL